MASSHRARSRDERATLNAQGVMEAERSAREAKTARLREARLAWEEANQAALKPKPAPGKDTLKKR
jgi:hypothetical protein